MSIRGTGYRDQSPSGSGLWQGDREGDFHLRYRVAPFFLRDDLRNWENPKRYRWGCHLKASRKNTTSRDHTDFSFFHQPTQRLALRSDLVKVTAAVRGCS